MEQKRNQNYLQNGQSHRETSDRPDSQNRDSHEIIINTTGRNNCGGRCLIHVHMKDGKIERLTTETEAEASYSTRLLKSSQLNSRLGIRHFWMRKNG